MDLHLTANADGSIVISNARGPVSIYSPDSRTAGAFFSQPGDTSTLFGLGNGVYQLEDPHGHITSFLANGDIDYVIDSNGNRVTAGYTDAGQLSSLTHSDGEYIDIAYNAAGLISSVANSGGHSTTYAYDATNQYLLSATTGDGKVTSYTYQTTGAAQAMNALLSITGAGVTRTFTYDSEGRLGTTYLGNNQQTVTLGYSSIGAVSVSDGFGTTNLFYGAAGQLLKTQDPLGNITSARYDANGRLVSFVLPTGVSEAFAWDGSGDVTSITDQAGNKTKSQYNNAYRELSSFTDAMGNATHYSYDANANLLSTTYANNSSQTYSGYSASGLPATYTAQNGLPIQYTYNAAGKVADETFADGSHNDFTYDSRGNDLTATKTSSSGVSDTTTYSYAYSTDGDRLEKVAYANGRYLVYTYDNYGRETSVTDQTGYSTNYDYDAAGRLWHVRDGSANLLVTYSYDAAGRLSRIDKGNGTFTTYAYDAAGNILRLQNWQNATTLNSEFIYTYNSLGQRTTMTTLDGTWTYTYDPTGELTYAVFVSINPAIPNQDLLYNYDADGNRTSTVINGVTTQYIANNLNEYTSVGGIGYKYDANGNLIFDGTNAYTYNQQNQLISVSGPSGVTQYEYDSFGNRTASIVNGMRAEYLLAPTGAVNVIGEYDGTRNSVTHNIFGLGLVGSTIGNGSDFYDFDAQGSTVGISNSSGVYVSDYAYLPFGQILASSGPVNLFQFVGRFGVMTSPQLPNVLGIGVRALMTSIGRFTSVDFTGLASGSTNFYEYAANSPAEFIDVTGNDVAEVVRGIGPAIKAGDFTLYDVGNLQNALDNYDKVRQGFGNSTHDPRIVIQLLPIIPTPPSGWLDALHSAYGYVKQIFEITGLPLVNPQDSSERNSFDPNDITGAAGFGAQNFISDSTTTSRTSAPALLMLMAIISPLTPPPPHNALRSLTSFHRISIGRLSDSARPASAAPSFSSPPTSKAIRASSRLQSAATRLTCRCKQGSISLPASSTRLSRVSIH